MSELPKRRLGHKCNGRCNELGPDEQLTSRPACEYAATLSVLTNTNILALDRGDGKGPPYYKINGLWIRDTPRYFGSYIENRKTRLVVPACAVGGN